MPTVRLSGTVIGPEDPNRSTRAKLLFHLFNAGWSIYNSNGDQKITLGNIESKIIESEAFVFTPGATLEDFFKAISIFVGYQTLDKHLAAKPTVILNDDNSWDIIFQLLTHLNKLGTVKQDYRDYLLAAETPDQVTEILSAFRENDQGLPPIDREPLEEKQAMPTGPTPPSPTTSSATSAFSAPPPSRKKTTSPTAKPSAATSPTTNSAASPAQAKAASWAPSCAAPSPPKAGPPAPTSPTSSSSKASPKASTPSGFATTSIPAWKS